MHPENTDAIISLYMRMPGAPKPPYDDERGMLWGECEGNDHWEFCREIVRKSEKATVSLQEFADLQAAVYDLQSQMSDPTRP